LLKYIKLIFKGAFLRVFGPANKVWGWGGGVKDVSAEKRKSVYVIRQRIMACSNHTLVITPLLWIEIILKSTKSANGV